MTLSLRPSSPPSPSTRAGRRSPLADPAAEDGQHTRRWFGPAWHRRVGTIDVLSLEGSPYEMGRQHGALLADQVRRGPLPYYRRYIERSIALGGLGGMAPLIAAGVQQVVGSRVARAMPPEAKESIRGLADGSSIPYRELLQGCVMPDSLMWVAARMMRLKRVGRETSHRLALGLGCSSAITYNGASRDGRLMHARNIDYHGVACWPRTTAVIFHRPQRGQRYVAVTAAGIPLAGITSMNEAGLTLTVHQHMFTDKTRLGGTPVGIVGDRIMREATSLEQARAILDQHTPIGCWTYIIADGHRKRVLCFEENPFRRAAFYRGPDDHAFGYANIYLDPELGASERALYGSYWRHNMGRQRMLWQRLRERRPFDPDSMAGLLGEVGDSGCRIREAIAMLMTVGSVVFRPEDGALWVATGEAPVSHNPFEPFSLARGDHAPEHGRLRDGQPRDDPARQAFEHYRRAYLAYFDDDDLARARDHLSRTLELAPDQPLYHVVAALLEIKAGEPLSAWERLGRALDLGHPDPERIAAMELWRGRAADLAGRRARALEAYRRVERQRADAPVARAARSGLRRAYTRRAARRVGIDFSFADVMAP